MDLNHCAFYRTDLQSVAFNHSATPPWTTYGSQSSGVITEFQITRTVYSDVSSSLCTKVYTIMPRTKIIAIYGAIAMMAAVMASTAAIPSTKYRTAFMLITQASSGYRRGDDGQRGKFLLQLPPWFQQQQLLAARFCQPQEHLQQLLLPPQFQS